MGKIYQIQAAFASSFGSLIMGMFYTWPSYTLSLYKAENNTILSEPMSDFESSLLGSLPSLGAMAGTAVAGILIDRVGRQKGGIVLSLPFVLAWLMIQLSSTSLMILIARFAGGFSGGAFLVFAPMFISEVAEDSIRGALASGPVVAYCFGALISYIFGWVFSYQAVIWANIAISVICALLFVMVKESPVFLVRRNRDEDAREAIAHYRGVSSGSKVVLEELSRLKQQLLPAVELISVTDSDAKVEDTEKDKLQEGNHVEIDVPKMSSLKMLLTSPSSRRGFFIVAFVLSIQVLMGMVAVQVYAKELFATAAPGLSSNLCSVIFAFVLIGGSGLVTAVADKAGRRILIISSSVAVTICMMVLGFQLQSEMLPPWVSAVIILLYCFFFMGGAGTVPYVLIAEVFIPEVQGLASTLLLEWVWLLNFLLVAIFPYLVKFLGLAGSFYSFGVMAAIDAVVCYFIVPETKGLSLQQIQELLNRKR